MTTIRVPYKGKGHSVSYKMETIDLSTAPLEFINVYSVFIEDPELRELVGEHFSMVYKPIDFIRPVFEIFNPDNTEAINLKKTIAQQIMNNPTN